MQVQRGGEAVHAMKLFQQLKVAELVQEQGLGGVVGGPGGARFDAGGVRQEIFSSSPV